MRKLNHIIKTFTISLSLSLLCLSTLPAHAQLQEETPNWYDVELIVFSNTDPALAFEEKWRKDLQLSYPASLITLKPENYVAERFDENFQGAQQTESTTANENTATESSAITAQATPFQQLPASARQLNSEARRLTQSPRHRILFHQAWRQTLDKGDSNNIRIDGGGQFDQNRELQGWINIRLNRYLHIDTDLWLSNFVSNVGQANTDWPTLPIPLRRDLMNSQNSENAAGKTETFSFGNNQPSDFGFQFNRIISNKYLIDRIVVMRQSRRMRTGELHYIDHPLFGVIVRINKYTPPEKTEEEPATSL